MKKFALVCLATAICVSAGPVGAEDYRIAFGDLDLSSVSGPARFDGRVRSAAQRACLRTGSLIADARCVARFQEEAVRLLPSIAREDYARARGGRVLAEVPMIYG